MRKQAALLLLLLSAGLAFTACGDEPKNTDSASEGGTTLHVRAAGMVKSLGIT